MRRLSAGVSLFLFLGLLALAQAQPPAATYLVQMRYKIDADLQQRYAFYKQMLARFQSAGFTPAQGRPREELYGDRLAGSIPSTGIGSLRLEKFVRTAVLVPAGYALPTDIEKTVLVRLELALTGPDRQRELADLARQQLKPMGFVENEGYDHQGHTRILGRLPGPALDVLLKDTMEVTIPSSFKTTSVTALKAPLIRLAIVIAESAPPAPDVARPVPAPAGKEYLDKISPDLKAFLAKVPESDLDKFTRIELVLRTATYSDNLRNSLAHSEAFFSTEGSFGPIVTGLTTPSRITALAQHADISTVRLPQAAKPIGLSYETIVLGGELGRTSAITPVNYVAPRPARRLLFVGDDFRGYQKLIGEGLPKQTRLIDVTAELSVELQPQAEAAGEGIGRSAQLAKEFLANHPHDEVILARINSTTPFQLQQLGEATLGKPWNTGVFLARKEEWRDAGVRLESERLELRVMRRRIQGDFTLDEATKAKRDEHRTRQTALDAADKNHFALGQRIDKFLADMRDLRGMTSVCVGLQWDQGYTDLPGSAPHLRFVTSDVLRACTWYQIVSSRPYQVWTNLYRDSDGDQVMEFTTNTKNPRPDLAFLAWKPAKAGSNELILPENAVVEVTLNWFEVHAAANGSLDVYRKPLAHLSINVLKQRDPTGLKLPLDTFEVVARSPVLADRVENNNRGSHYQSTLRFTVPAGGGRYALQVVGQTPSSTSFASVDSKSTERSEIHPKITLDVIDPARKAEGRVVFESVATPE